MRSAQGIVAGHAVGPEESPLGLGAPIEAEGLDRFELARAALPLPVDGGPRRIVEGAQHGGDVARRRRLLAAFLDRLVRLAFEIDNVDVVLGDENLGCLLY